MAAGGITGRVLVVAVDPLGEASTGLLHWVCREFVRPGDVVHLVHVARIMSPTLTIQHGFPSASYNIPDPLPHVDERKFCDDIRQLIKDKLVKILDSMHVKHSLHIFVDTDNAPASAVFTSIRRVADEVQATAIILASHNKTSSHLPVPGAEVYKLGSLAEYAIRNAALPVITVPPYTPPLVIPMSSPHHTP